MDKPNNRLIKALGLLLCLGAAFVLVVFVLKPPCLIYKATGLYCPGCGGQRMIWALLRGDFAQALRQNALLLFLLPLAGGYALWEAARYVKEKPPLYQKKPFLWAAGAVLALSLVYMLLRNLPQFAFLAPV